MGTATNRCVQFHLLLFSSACFSYSFAEQVGHLAKAGRIGRSCASFARRQTYAPIQPDCLPGMCKLLPQFLCMQTQLRLHVVGFAACRASACSGTLSTNASQLLHRLRSMHMKQLYVSKSGCPASSMSSNELRFGTGNVREFRPWQLSTLAVWM